LERNAGIQLVRALSKCGYCSRSRARQLILCGRVHVNGKVQRNPERTIFPGGDEIEVDGQRIRAAKKIYLMLNKPRGIITSANDDKGRATVYSMLPDELPWIAPVGRLDKASEGLLLLTNDSEWAARIAAPDAHVDKTYHVQIAAVASQELLERMMKGIRVKPGQALRVKRAAMVRAGVKNSWLEIVLDEGKNRQIRRIMNALGIEVLRLIRIAIGPVQLGTLGKGKFRELSAAEVAELGG